MEMKFTVSSPVIKAFLLIMDIHNSKPIYIATFSHTSTNTNVGAFLLSFLPLHYRGVAKEEAREESLEH